LNDNFVRTIKFWCMIGSIIIVIIIAGILIFKYNVEGEKKMAYKLSKITIISTAEGVEDTLDETDQNTWNLKILQNNDVFFTIDKTEFAKENNDLKGVRIENIQVVKKPKLGSTRIYMPNSTEGKLYNYTNDYIVNSTLQYNGAEKNNPKTLEISKDGGIALISFVNSEIGNFKSTEKNIEIKHDATLIPKINDLTNYSGILSEDLKFSVQFDLVIKIDNNEYKGTVKLDLPNGDILTNGKSTLEIKDFSKVVFKRSN